MSVKSIAKKAFKANAITEEEYKQLLCVIRFYYRSLKPQDSEWIKIFENPFTNGYVCPFCGHKIQVTEQFLPKVTECEVCGADMRKKET